MSQQNKSCGISTSKSAVESHHVSHTSPRYGPTPRVFCLFGARCHLHAGQGQRSRSTVKGQCVSTFVVMLSRLKNSSCTMGVSRLLAPCRGARTPADYRYVPGYVRVEPGHGKGLDGRGEEFFEWEILLSRSVESKGRRIK